MGFGLVVYGLTTLVPVTQPSAWEFAWRPWALLFIVCLVALVAQIAAVNRPQNRSRTTLWFTFYVGAVVWTMLGLLAGMLATTLVTYTYWLNVAMIGILLLGPAMLFYIMAYIGQEERMYRPLTLPMVVIPAILLFHHATAVLDVNDGSKYSKALGYLQFASAKADAPYTLIVVWLFMFVFLGSALLASEYRTTQLERRRSQIRMLLIAAAAPAVIGAVPEVFTALAPYVAIVTALCVLMQSSLTAYAMLHYGVFTVNPSMLAETILATMNEAVLAVNPGLEIERANAVALRMLGKPIVRVEGMTLEQAFGTEVERKLVHQIGSGSNDALELDLPHGGHTRPISVLTSPIRHSSGAVAGFILVFRDVTKEHAAKAEIERQVVERTEQLHEEQVKLKTSIESLSLGFVMVDAGDRVVLSNTAVGQLLEPGRGEWTLATLGQKFGSGLKLTELAAEVRRTGEHKYIQRLEVGKKYLRLFLTPVEYRPGATGLVVLIEDITEQEVLNRSKDEFFSIASHELRTPLTVIRGNASMILEFYSSALDKATIDMMHDIHESSARLIGIVNDFLDVSRLEQGKVSFSYGPVPLDQVIKTVMFEMKAIMQSKHLKLSFEPAGHKKLPAVWSDQNRLKQVLFNLIGNAAKFTEHGGVTVTAAVEGNMVKVTVADTGRGIPPARQNLLFRKFQQAGESLLTRDTSGGTGLGLYISKRLVEGMGGSMQLESSEEGKGSVFSFTVPVAGEAKGHELQTAGTDGKPS